MQRRNPAGRLLLLAAALAAAVFAVLYLRDRGLGFRDVLAWLEGLGPLLPLYWILLVAAAVVLLLPMPVIAPVGGFLFGAGLGTLYSVSGMVIGCTAAFLAGRRVLAGRTDAWLHRHPRLQGFNRGLEDQGWRFILSTRLLPGFPVKVSNYVFGGLGYPLKGFVVGNLLGLLPYQVAGAYAGSLLSDISDPARLAELTKSPLNLSVSLGGLAVAVLLLVYCIRRAARAMKRQTGAPAG
jgi:uncharacterized membrane protein YdjX (TVP38/TMEM64 family)